MLRRVASLVLLPCLLLAQSASLGHAHGKNTPAGHESRPHVHIALVANHHEHGGAHQHHHHGKGGHHHDADGGSSFAADSLSKLAAAPENDSGHDDDAVYFSSPDVARTRLAAHDTASDLVWFAALAPSATDYDLVREDAAPPRPPSPVGRAGSRPLYIQHSALLI